MAEQIQLKKILKSVMETQAESKDSSKTLKGAKKLHLTDYTENHTQKGSIIEKDQKPSSKLKASPKKGKKLSTKKQKAGSTVAKKSSEPSETKEMRSLTSLKTTLSKEEDKTSNNKMKTKTHNWSEDVLKVVEARKFQMMSKAGTDQGITSPLQMHLIRSESLRIAQDKIVDLEEELHKFRQKNESLVSASEVLKEKNEFLQSSSEDLKYRLTEIKDNFKNEKEIIMSALEEAKTQINKLKSKKQEMEKRLSRDLHGIHARENSLESRIEILKMENSVLQREKDKKIIELKKQIQKIKANLEGAHKKNQDLQTLNNKLQESSRRTVSSLRATIYNLEGVSSKNEETIVTEFTEKK